MRDIARYLTQAFEQFGVAIEHMVERVGKQIELAAAVIAFDTTCQIAVDNGLRRDVDPIQASPDYTTHPPRREDPDSEHHAEGRGEQSQDRVVDLVDHRAIGGDHQPHAAIEQRRRCLRDAAIAVLRVVEREEFMPSGLGHGRIELFASRLPCRSTSM